MTSRIRDVIQSRPLHAGGGAVGSPPVTGVSRPARRRRGFAHAALVALALLAVVALAVAGSFRVLCVTADGHVGIEPAASTCCGTEAPESGGGEGSDDGCGGCIDLVVEGDVVRVDHGPACESAAEAAALVAAHVDVGTNARNLVRSESPPREPEVPRGPLADLRTVVLRC